MSSDLLARLGALRSDLIDPTISVHTAQLIDAETGGHLWADRFDRELSDIFAVQDEVTRRIVDALKIKLSPGESARLGDVETTNAKAHDFFLAGREALWGTTRNRETFERSTALCEKAIGEDPSYGEPYAGLAFAQILNWQFHWTDDWMIRTRLPTRRMLPSSTERTQSSRAITRMSTDLPL